MSIGTVEIQHGDDAWEDMAAEALATAIGAVLDQWIEDKSATRIDLARAILGAMPPGWDIFEYDDDDVENFPTADNGQAFRLVDVPVVDGKATLPDGRIVLSDARIVRVPVPA